MDTNWFVIYYQPRFPQTQRKTERLLAAEEKAAGSLSVEEGRNDPQRKQCPVREESLRRKAYSFSVVAGIWLQ